MEDKVDLSAADKARLVWEAARIRGAKPLDDVTATALGEDLEWAAQYRTIADSPIPSRERERLKSIKLTVGKLLCLLDKCSATRIRFE
jgi:hypothetical protein